MHDNYPKKGKVGKPKGYSDRTNLKSKDCDFYGSQGTFAKKPEHERMDLYAKPGTSAAKRQPDPYEVSMPRSRYRSQFP